MATAYIISAVALGAWLLTSVILIVVARRLRSMENARDDMLTTIDTITEAGRGNNTTEKLRAYGIQMFRKGEMTREAQLETAAEAVAHHREAHLLFLRATTQAVADLTSQLQSVVSVAAGLDQDLNEAIGVAGGFDGDTEEPEEPPFKARLPVFDHVEVTDRNVSMVAASISLRGSGSIRVQVGETVSVWKPSSGVIVVWHDDGRAIAHLDGATIEGSWDEVAQELVTDKTGYRIGVDGRRRDTSTPGEPA